MSPIEAGDLLLVERGGAPRHVATVAPGPISNAQPSDLFLVQRGTTQHKAAYAQLPALLDGDLVLVQRGTTQYKATGNQVKAWLGHPLWAAAGQVPAFHLDFSTGAPRELINSQLGTFTRPSSQKLVWNGTQFVTVAADTPAVQKDPATGRWGALMEPSATNAISDNQEFSIWGLAAASIVSNDGVAPDGTSTADRVVSTGGGPFRTNLSVVNAAPCTYSVFLKHVAGTGVVDRIGFEKFGAGAPIPGKISVNLLTGNVIESGASVVSSSITPFHNGWYRVTVAALAADTEAGITIYAPGGNEFLVWGAQLETGAVATSPILTAGTPVTRAADIWAWTGPQFTDWYNQAGGTWVVSGLVRYEATDRIPFSISAGGYDTALYVSKAADNGLYFFGVPDIFIGTGSQADLSSFAIALSYTSPAGSAAASRNGATPGTDPSATISNTMAKLVLGDGAWGSGGSNGFNAPIFDLAYFPPGPASTRLQQLSAIQP